VGPQEFRSIDSPNSLVLQLCNGVVIMTPNHFFTGGWPKSVPSPSADLVQSREELLPKPQEFLNSLGILSINIALKSKKAANLNSGL
jgi:hypothetical protein